MLLPNMYSYLATFRLSVMMMLPHQSCGVKVESVLLRIMFLNVLRKLVVLGEALLVSFFGWIVSTCVRVSKGQYYPSSKPSSGCLDLVG